MQEWLRYEWIRSGVQMYKANQACGVKNAATRRYLTADHLWYYPPPEAFERMAAYVNQHGHVDGRPGTSAEMDRPRSPPKNGCDCAQNSIAQLAYSMSGCIHRSAVRSASTGSAARCSGIQKPSRESKATKLVELAMATSEFPGDVIWEPFGGLCPAAICAVKLQRTCVSAEIIPEFYAAAARRLAAV